MVELMLIKDCLFNQRIVISPIFRNYLDVQTANFLQLVIPQGDNISLKWIATNIYYVINYLKSQQSFFHTSYLPFLLFYSYFFFLKYISYRKTIIEQC